MKNPILLISIFFILAFANCEFDKNNIDNQSIELKKGLIINSNTNIKKQDYQLLAESENEKIITIEGDSLTVDFNNISLIGTAKFTKPDQFKGVAIHIKNSNSVRIENLNISGFRIALQVDNVQNLTIDSCHFTYNYRADSSAIFDINKVEIGAVVLNNSENIIITNSTISNNYNGIILNNSTLSELGKNEIQFNSKVGIYLNQSKIIDIYKNQIDWNLEAANWYQNTRKFGTYVANSITHNGNVETLERWYNSNDFMFSDIDLTTELNIEEYALEKSKIPPLNPKYPKGEAYKLPTKYGVYNFEYPAIFLRTMNKNEYTFAMFGPSVGNWKFVGSENITAANLKTGTFPATFIIKKEDSNKPFSLEFEFIGERFQDEFGVWNEKGKVYKFGF